VSCTLQPVSNRPNRFVAGTVLGAIVATAAVVATAFVRVNVPARRSILHEFPPLVLWAWDRPENLRGLGDDVGVAFLGATVTLRGQRSDVRLRRPHLKVDPDTPLMAVVRVESDRLQPPALTAAQQTAIVQAIARVAALPGVRAAQLDFDAVLSERAFYRSLIGGIRRAIPQDMPLSMTALTSWCSGDPWLDDLVVDEVVPMAFRTASAADRAIKLTAAHGSFPSARCRQSVGISTDEPIGALAPRERVYVFHPRAWTADAVTAVRREAATWR
jgi:hypothetical protein